MPTVQGSSPASATAVRCHVAGFAACRFAPEQLPLLRQKPGPLQGTPLPVSFLKHSDEQTIAGIAAVSLAIQDHSLQQVDFSQWGVVGAARFFARAKLAVVLSRFGVEGAWGISPHLIPHRSQHALSGTISQALKIHGPNYGVGGGPDSAAEALLAAAAMLADDRLPGVWVVVTGYDPELVPAEEHPAANTPPALPTSDCLALTMALMPEPQRERTLVLSVGAAPAQDPKDCRPPFSLETIVKHLAGGQAEPAQWWLRCGGWATLEHAETAEEICL
jgi:hypothetical protein